MLKYYVKVGKFYPTCVGTEELHIRLFSKERNMRSLRMDVPWRFYPIAEKSEFAVLETELAEVNGCKETAVE